MVGVVTSWGDNISAVQVNTDYQFKHHYKPVFCVQMKLVLESAVKTSLGCHLHHRLGFRNHILPTMVACVCATIMFGYVMDPYDVKHTIIHLQPVPSKPAKLKVAAELKAMVCVGFCSLFTEKVQVVVQIITGGEQQFNLKVILHSSLGGQNPTDSPGVYNISNSMCVFPCSHSHGNIV